VVLSFALGLVSGLLLALLLAAYGTWADRHRPRRGGVVPRNRMSGGQMVMGPNQPRPRPQEHIPAPPPRNLHSGGWPEGMPRVGTSDGSGQAKGC
jgi:hypothetical protein